MIRKRKRKTVIITHHLNVNFHLEEVQELVLVLGVRVKAILLMILS